MLLHLRRHGCNVPILGIQDLAARYVAAGGLYRVRSPLSFGYAASTHGMRVCT
jgi:hypothetical protein